MSLFIPDQQSYYKIGHIARSHGRAGTLKISLALPWPAPLATPPHVYIYQHHTYVPYQVQEWQLVKGYLLLTLTQVKTQEQSDLLQDWDIYVDWEWLGNQLQGEHSLAYLVFCTDFTAYDRRGHRIGKVVGVQDRKLQPLLIIEDAQEEEILVPIHEKFIGEIDWEERKVEVENDY